MQTVENQRFEISNFCKNRKLLIDDWIEETISGTKNYSKRQLGKLLKKWVKMILSFAVNCHGLGVTCL